MSFISPSTAKSFNLKAIDSKQICIKSFRGNAVTINLDAVKFTVKNKNGTLDIIVTAMCNEICHPLVM